MKLKKIAAVFLAIVFMLCCTPVQMAIANNELTLHEFLKTTDSKEVITSFNYPSMKLTDNAEGNLMLPAHTPIIIRCVETISTRDVVSGGTVKFVVASNVKDSNGNILIRSNTPVTAQISFAKAKGMIGKSGELTITDFHTTAVDGAYVPLSSSVSASGDEKVTLSIVLSVLVCPLFLLMKGEEAQVPAGTTKTAYTVSDIYIKPAKV